MGRYIRYIMSRKSIKAVIVASLLILVIVPLSVYKLFSPAPLTLAMVTTLSGGAQASQGREALNGAQLYIDSVNEAGGVNGHPLKLQVLDDGFNANQAGSIARQVIASPALLTLGPIYSAAVPQPVNAIYARARLPMIAASVSYDDLTKQNPYAFRLRTLTTPQGNTSAVYVNKILNMHTASIVYADTAYGKRVADAFQKTFTGQTRELFLDPNSLNPQTQKSQCLQTQNNQCQPLASIVTMLTTPGAQPGIVFLAMTDVNLAGKMIMQLRREDPTIQILCADGIDSDLLPSTLAATEKMEDLPQGYFTNGVYASSPVIYDSAPDDAQTFATQYRQKYGNAFGWFSANYYDAAQVAVVALSRANVKGTPASLNSDREQILDQLLGMNSPQTGVEGLNGPLYFNNSKLDKNGDPISNSIFGEDGKIINNGNHDGSSPIRFGQFLNGRLHSLPTQLMEVSTADRANLLNNKCTGDVIQVGLQCFWKQRVVYAGIDIRNVSSIDVTTSTFSADFDLWMRYNGDNNVTNITFNNASNTSFDPAKPQVSDVFNGLQRRLYHVTGNFKDTYDFRQYPFDQQQLNISFQNQNLTSEHLVYAIDAQLLGLRDNNTANPTNVMLAFKLLSSWTYQGTQYASDTFTTRSTLGDPRLLDQHTRTDYSGLQLTMTVQRKTLAYLISHVLPLALLFMVVYASLHLPFQHLGDRLTLTVTALLASTVLLLSINSELPEIGYAVSLDYIYYVFFALCLVCIMVPIWLYQKQPPVTTRWNIVLHTTYIATVIITIAYYLVTYGNSFV